MMSMRFRKFLAITACLGCFNLSLGFSAARSIAAPTQAPKSAASDRSSIQSSDAKKALIDEAWQLVNRQYVDPNFNKQDWGKLRKQLLDKTYRTDEEAYSAIRDALKLLGDRHTRFMDPTQFAALNVQDSNNLVGIGLRMDVDPITQKIRVVEPIPDAPASQAGIQPNDILAEVNGKTTQKQSVEDVARLLRGKPGEIVTVLIQRGQTQQTFRIARAKVLLQSVLYASQETSVGIVGYIRIVQFDVKSNLYSAKAIQQLEKEGVYGYVLDLRSSSGGLLKNGIEIARQWLDQGDILTMKTRDGVEKETANQTALTQKPLVILVDQGTTAGSEILAAALQENGRAQLVGAKTFGHNVIGAVHPLMGRSGIVITIAKWMTPKQNDISGKGLIPDVFLELSPAQRTELSSNPKLIGTVADPQFAKALELLGQLKNSPSNTKQIAPSPSK